MATRRVELGTVGDTVRSNIRTRREAANLRLDDFAERLARDGRPMSKSTLSQIETGGRRVDVDDLVAIARALGVSVDLLLAPETQTKAAAALDEAASAQSALSSAVRRFDRARADLVELLPALRTAHERDNDERDETRTMLVRAARVLEVTPASLLNELQEDYANAEWIRNYRGDD